MSNYFKAFNLELKRTNLAISGKHKELLKTYNKRNPEIPDLNSPELWDKLNKDFINQDIPMSKDRVGIVAKMIRGENIKVLNIGLGSANLEKTYFKNNSLTVEWYSIDISNQSVKAAKKLFPKLHFSIGNIKHLTFKEKCFDYVIALEVMEHIQPRDTFKALREVSRVLKKGGYVIISVPLNEGLEQYINRGENPNAHVRVYTPNLIKAELEIVGFEIKKSQLLYAFNKYYTLKTLISKFLPGFRNPNNIILLARK